LRYLYVLIGMVVLVSAASAANISTKIDVDSYVDAEEPEEYFTDSDMLWVTSESGEPIREAYLSMITNNFGSAGVFNPDQIESATLRLYATEVESPGIINAYFVEGATLEANWDDKPEYQTDISASLEIEGEGEYAMDVTELLKEARASCLEDCGYTLVLVASDNASVGFASIESYGEIHSLEYTTAN
jgi:hypothetical protein